MDFGAIIIGDEILSGKRQDKHIAKVIESLGSRGLQLAWAQYLGDDPALITETLERTMRGGDAVFSFGRCLSCRLPERISSPMMIAADFIHQL